MATNTVSTDQDVSAELLESIKNEMHALGINPLHLNFVKQGVKTLLNEAKGKDEFLIPMGIYHLPECTHTKTLADHKADCKSYYSENYTKHGLDKEVQTPGPAISIDMRKMQKGKDGNYQKIFDSFGKPLAELAIPQNRIVDIIFSVAEQCKKLRDDADLKDFWLHLLVKKENVEAGDEEFFVFGFRLGDGVLFGAYPLSSGGVWFGENEIRIGVLAV